VKQWLLIRNGGGLVKATQNIEWKEKHIGKHLQRSLWTTAT
jgi:hypothetical protein